MRSAELIRKARTEAGLSQADLAARAGSSQPAVARREAGTEEPTLPTLRRLLYACGFELVVEARSLPPSTRRVLLQHERARILGLLASRGATEVRVFGSVARGEDDEESDIDLLVQLPAGRSAASRLMTVLGLSEELRELLGARVHVAEETTLEPEVLRRALREAVPL